MTTTETKTFKTPFFKDLNDDALREAYWGYRALAYNNAAIAQSAPRSLGKLSRQMGFLMRNIDIIEALARKRGISLAR